MWNNSDEFEIEEEEIKIFKKRKQSKRNNKGYRKIKIRIRRAKMIKIAEVLIKEVKEIDTRFRRIFKRDIN